MFKFLNTIKYDKNPVPALKQYVFEFGIKFLIELRDQGPAIFDQDLVIENLQN